MSYCTVSDVRYHSPDITPEDSSDSAVSFFIAAAEADINDALRDMYVVPFTTVPTGVRFLCARIAAYYTIQSFPDRVSLDDLERLDEGIQRDLQKYATGKKKLGSDYEITAPVDGTYFAATAREQTYSDYEVD